MGRNYKGANKCSDDVTILSETVFAWAKRVEAQRVQTVVISSLHESKNFDAITHKEIRQRNKTHMSNTIITRKKCK